MIRHKGSGLFRWRPQLKPYILTEFVDWINKIPGILCRDCHVVFPLETCFHQNRRVSRPTRAEQQWTKCNLSMHKRYKVHISFLVLFHSSYANALLESFIQHDGLSRNVANTHVRWTMFAGFAFGSNFSSGFDFVKMLWLILVSDFFSKIDMKR